MRSGVSRLGIGRTSGPLAWATRRGLLCHCDSGDRSSSTSQGWMGSSRVFPENGCQNAPPRCDPLLTALLRTPSLCDFNEDMGPDLPGGPPRATGTLTCRFPTASFAIGAKFRPTPTKEHPVSSIALLFSGLDETRQNKHISMWIILKPGSQWPSAARRGGPVESETGGSSRGL